MGHPPFNMLEEHYILALGLQWACVALHLGSQ